MKSTVEGLGADSNGGVPKITSLILTGHSFSSRFGTPFFGSIVELSFKISSWDRTQFYDVSFVLAIELS